MKKTYPEDLILKVGEEEKLEEISNLFSEKRVYTFLVGAGISMDPPSCVPSARMFVNELLSYYAPEKEIEILSKLDSLRYEFLVEKIQDLFDKEITFLDYLDEVKEPNANHVFLANMIMRYNAVVTTNFDYLIEIGLKNKLVPFPSFHDYHKKVMVIITKEDYEKDVRFQFPIIKIHGSKWDCIKGRLTKDSLITTVSALGKDREKGRTFAIEPYKKKLIDSIMQYRDLIVMGYSGSDDFDIGPMLKELTSIKRLIWIDHDETLDSEEIYKFKKLTHLKLDSVSGLSKQDYMLLEIASKNNIEVFKVKAKTINFVKYRLAPIFNENFDTLKENLSQKVPSFSEYMEKNHFKATNSFKYRLSHELYSNLGDIQSTERTALAGLSYAKEENNDINEMYFTNALGLLYLTKGDLDRAFEQFNEALQLTDKLNQSNEKIGVLINIGEYYRNKGDVKNALKHIVDALNISSEKTPNLLKFSILNSLGVIYKANGDIQNAIKNIELALEFAEKMGDLFRKALCYNNLAGIYFSQGLLNPALTNASEALKINELLGDLDEMASNFNTIGNIYRIAGNYNQALNYLEQAYRTAEKTKNLGNMALAANSIGVIYFESGKIEMAIKMYNESYNIRKNMGDLSGQATSLNNIGMVYRAKRDYNIAHNFFNQSIEISEKIGEKEHLAVRYANRGSIHEARREFDKALEEYKKALTIERSQQNLQGIASQFFNIGGILGELGKHDECITNYSNALSIMEDLKIKPGIAQALNNLGTVYFKFKKDYEKSILLLERALEIYKEINNPQMMLSTQQNLDYIKKQYENQN
ncbi:MAG TPA: tetratricopeptide repeat protein [Candidatus Nanopelagicaceae bacterium]|nr:tetratricopeptide repeat protein [Candidatus Nanopelagicaceae bacterium]